MPVNLPELTPEEKAAIDAIDMTPILGTPSERLQFAMDKAIVYFRRARLAEKEAAMLRSICKAAEAECRQARDAIQSVLSDPTATCSEYTKTKLLMAKGWPVPGHLYRVYYCTDWDAVETAILALNHLANAEGSDDG